jgi:hypothetical protein
VAGSVADFRPDADVRCQGNRKKMAPARITVKAVRLKNPLRLFERPGDSMSRKAVCDQPSRGDYQK